VWSFKRPHSNSKGKVQCYWSGETQNVWMGMIVTGRHSYCLHMYKKKEREKRTAVSNMQPITVWNECKLWYVSFVLEIVRLNSQSLPRIWCQKCVWLGICETTSWHITTSTHFLLLSAPQTTQHTTIHCHTLLSRSSDVTESCCLKNDT